MIKTYLLAVLFAVLPISELRGAIPYAYFNGISLPLSFAISVTANALVAPFGLLFLNTLNRLFCKIPVYQKFFDKTVLRARGKVEQKINKYGVLGLMLFVAVPLPITGAWTGILGAWVLGLDKKKSILSVILGVFIAGLVVSIVVYTGSSLSSLFTKTL